MGKKNKGGVAVLPPTDMVKPEVQEERTKEIQPGLDPVMEAKYLGPAAALAGSRIYVRNKKLPDAREHFPQDPLARTVDKWFGSAKGGELWIDEPSLPDEIARAEAKLKLAEKLGIRYTYILPHGGDEGMTESKVVADAMKRMHNPKPKEAPTDGLADAS